MNPIRFLKNKLADKVRAIAHSEAQNAVHNAIPLMQRIADFAASTPDMRQSAHDLTKSPRDNASVFETLRNRLERSGVPVEEFEIDTEAFATWAAQYPEIEEQNRNLGDVSVEKSLEHYLSHSVLTPQPKQVYLDVAASNSPYAMRLRARGVEAYRLDVAYPPGRHGYDIGADATNTGLPDAFADCMALHCSFECFAGDADIRFLAEAKRMLKPGGTCVILPLYLGKEHNVVSSPYCPDGATPETADPEGLFLWRDDPYHVPFGRTYSPETFAQRIHNALPEGLRGRVRYAKNMLPLMQQHPGQRIYCFFQYVLTRGK